MIEIAVDRFQAWRATARKLLAANVAPEKVRWLKPRDLRPFLGFALAEDRGSTEGLQPADEPLLQQAGDGAVYCVPKPFMELAEIAACHANEGRWALLYRMLWRLTHQERALLEHPGDADVRAVKRMARVVREDARRTQTLARFRRCLVGEEEYFVAWQRPKHRILRLAVPFFLRRFSVMKWALLTPNETAFWNGRELRLADGVPLASDPAPSELENVWRDYLTNAFKPARLAAPVAAKPSLSSGVLLARRGPAEPVVVPAASCKGLTRPRLMLIGDHPSAADADAGRPFAGPAGNMLDEALARVGLDRGEIHLTNLVKQFRPAPRGQSVAARTGARDIAAWLPSLEAEILAARPELIVCLGAVAARALFGPEFRVTRSHGQVFHARWAPWTMATYHPAALWQATDETARARMHEQFFYDLRRVAEVLRDGPALQVFSPAAAAPGAYLPATSPGPLAAAD